MNIFSRSPPTANTPEGNQLLSGSNSSDTQCRFCSGRGQNLYLICNCQPPLNAAHVQCLIDAIQRRNILSHCYECGRDYRGVRVTITKPGICEWCRRFPQEKWKILKTILVFGYMYFIVKIGLMCMATNFWNIHMLIFYYLYDFSILIGFISICFLFVAIVKTMLEIHQWRDDNSVIRATANFSLSDPNNNLSDGRYVDPLHNNHRWLLPFMYL